MRWPLFLSLLSLPTLVFSQSEQLIAEHAALTSDCKSVRGHAQGIVSEASQSELNRDVALAQAQEVSKALESMADRLASTKKLLTATQSKSVASQYKTLEALCDDLRKECASIEKELSKAHPDRIKVRNMAVDLRIKMKNGSAEHDLIKKKLGIR